MRIGVVGINHKQADLGLRELLARACHRRFTPKILAESDQHFTLLSTCNRTEVYFHSDDLAKTHAFILQQLRCDVSCEFDQKLYSFFGYDCFLHLARVTAGLDSAILAETAVQGQVKECYEEASRHLSLPKELHYLFQKSLKIGKQVRSSLCFDQGLPNLEHAIYNVGREHFSKEVQPNVLLIGASAINKRIAQQLYGSYTKKISICSRTLENARNFATTCQGVILPWADRERWPSYDWVICGTKAPHHLLHASTLRDESAPCSLVIDLCVPRNVEPAIGQRINTYNIDQLNEMLGMRKASLHDALTSAEGLVASQTAKLLQLFKDKQKQSPAAFAVCA